MGCVQCAHELSCDAPRRRQRNEVQEAVQAENKKDHARQVSGDYGIGSYNRFSFWIGSHSMASSLLISIQLMSYTFRGFRLFYDPPSADGSCLARYDEGDARPDKVRSRWY